MCETSLGLVAQWALICVVQVGVVSCSLDLHETSLGLDAQWALICEFQGSADVQVPNPFGWQFRGVAFG